MNNIIATIILAARRERSDDFSWLVPVAVFIIWVIGSIFKAIGSAREARKERQRQRQKTGGKMKYKPLDTGPSAKEKAFPAPDRDLPYGKSVARQRPQKPARPEPEPSQAAKSLRQVMQQTLEEAYLQKQAKSRPAAARQVKARPPSKTPVRKPPRKVRPPAPANAKPDAPEPVVEIIPEYDGENILTALRHKDSLKKAIIYSEILGRPKALTDL